VSLIVCFVEYIDADNKDGIKRTNASGINVIVSNKPNNIPVLNTRTDAHGSFTIDDSYLNTTNYSISLDTLYPYKPDEQLVTWSIYRSQYIPNQITPSILNNFVPIQALPKIYTPLSGVNARLLLITPNVNDESIELDAVTVNVTMSQLKMPLYGYKSLYSDDIASGTLLAQGSFTLNVKGTFQLQQHYLEYAKGKSTSNQFNQHTIITNQDGISSKDKINFNITNQNAILPVPLTLKLVYTGQDGNYTTGYIMHNVQIGNMQQVLTPSGEPLGESYSFISKYVEAIRT